MNPSQLDIAFKAFHGREAKKQKQETVFLETVQRNHKRNQWQEGKTRKENRPLCPKQCAYCREGHCKKDCPKNEEKNAPRKGKGNHPNG